MCAMYDDSVARATFRVSHSEALPQVRTEPKVERLQFDSLEAIVHNSTMMRATLFLGLMMAMGPISCSCDDEDPGNGSNTDGGNNGGGGDGGGNNNGGGDGGGNNNGGGDGGTCEQLTVGSELEAPEVLVVFDQSNSMNEDNRWRSAVQAVGAVVVNLDLQVAFGIAFFGTGRSCGSVDVPIPPRVGNAAAISDELDDRNPQGNTPIAPMLQLISRLKDGENVRGQPTLENLKTVILMTDGSPNCNEDLDGDTCERTLQSSSADIHCLDEDRTVDAVEALAMQGVSTYVIGYSVSEWKDTLDAMAAAGTPGGTYFPVENASDLEASLGGIAQGITSCSFQLENTPEDITYVSVSLNGDDVPHTSQSGSGDGWDLQGNTVELLGDDCETARNDPTAVLDIKVECEQVFVIR